jgi:hypothetical protein
LYLFQITQELQGIIVGTQEMLILLQDGFFVQCTLFRMKEGKNSTRSKPV